jgi:hypothetical protein
MDLNPHETNESSMSLASNQGAGISRQSVNDVTHETTTMPFTCRPTEACRREVYLVVRTNCIFPRLFWPHITTPYNRLAGGTSLEISHESTWLDVQGRVGQVSRRYALPYLHLLMVGTVLGVGSIVAIFTTIDEWTGSRYTLWLVVLRSVVIFCLVLATVVWMGKYRQVNDDIDRDMEALATTLTQDVRMQHEGYQVVFEPNRGGLLVGRAAKVKQLLFRRYSRNGGGSFRFNVTVSQVGYEVDLVPAPPTAPVTPARLDDPRLGGGAGTGSGVSDPSPTAATRRMRAAAVGKVNNTLSCLILLELLLAGATGILLVYGIFFRVFDIKDDNN